MVYWYMQFTVFEPVEVLAHFNRMNINIIKFKRNSTIYRVSSFLHKWKLKEGNNHITHFVVECRDKNVICELAFSHSDFKWELIQYDHLE